MIQVQSIELRMATIGFFLTFEQISKTMKTVQQLEELRYKIVKWSFFNKATEIGT